MFSTILRKFAARFAVMWYFFAILIFTPFTYNIHIILRLVMSAIFCMFAIRFAIIWSFLTTFMFTAFLGYIFIISGFMFGAKFSNFTTYFTQSGSCCTIFFSANISTVYFFCHDKLSFYLRYYLRFIIN